MSDDKPRDDSNLVTISIRCDRQYAAVKKEVLALLEQEYFGYVYKRSGEVVIETARISGCDRKWVRKILKRHWIRDCTQGRPIQRSGARKPTQEPLASEPKPLVKIRSRSKSLERGKMLYLFAKGKNIPHDQIYRVRDLFEEPWVWNSLQIFLKRAGILVPTNQHWNRLNYAWVQERVPEDWKTALAQKRASQPSQ